ncbi:hypothetical protein SAMN04487944_10678 [Gracilibacillus ureilyticus]|uniref:Uncharacterized protein n=1 Tax=Gracilibacillus ureilyticus TaxID=531814 RepID=A0A1H9Q9V3_9BACI|nr:hypothetical protein SAMN04487944_10678 [Gracilibacillus ureilyticus]
MKFITSATDQKSHFIGGDIFVKKYDLSFSLIYSKIKKLWGNLS